MLGFEAIRAIRDTVNKVLKQDLPALVKQQIQEELHRGGMSIPTPSADAVLQNGVALSSRAQVKQMDAYGRIILNPLQTVYGDHDSLYQRMKNKINYGVNPDKIGLNNKGHFKTF